MLFTFWKLASLFQPTIPNCSIYSQLYILLYFLLSFDMNSFRFSSQSFTSHKIRLLSRSVYLKKKEIRLKSNFQYNLGLWKAYRVGLPSDTNREGSISTPANIRVMNYTNLDERLFPICNMIVASENISLCFQRHCIPPITNHNDACDCSLSLTILFFL